METQAASVKKIAITYGLFLGLILALSTTLMYVLNSDLFLDWKIGVVSIIIVITFGIVSTAKSKGALDGIMSFKEAFSAYFITCAVGLFISTLVGILIFTIVDPELADYLQEETLEISRGFMEKFGTPKADIDEALAKMSEQDNYSVVSQLKTYVYMLVFMSVIGLLIGLIFRKKDPNA
jgi:hypothetical protein